MANLNIHIGFSGVFERVSQLLQLLSERGHLRNGGFEAHDALLGVGVRVVHRRLEGHPVRSQTLLQTRE